MRGRHFLEVEMNTSGLTVCKARFHLKMHDLHDPNKNITGCV
jgi:hypothetical protein